MKTFLDLTIDQCHLRFVAALTLIRSEPCIRLMTLLLTNYAMIDTRPVTECIGFDGTEIH